MYAAQFVFVYITNIVNHVSNKHLYWDNCCEYGW
jgi:hypothetical protein